MGVGASSLPVSILIHISNRQIHLFLLSLKSPMARPWPSASTEGRTEPERAPLLGLGAGRYFLNTI